MSRIVKIAQTLRRNWKKSVFGFAVLGYGASYGYERYRILELMRAYCREAKRYGEQPIGKLERPRHVTVILNPEANDRKAKIRYEKYAAPILHLAGLRVSIFVTEHAGQATALMDVMENTDAVIIAGGDGTVLEAVTGFMRRPDFSENLSANVPIGILPLGKTNTVAKVLFSSKSSREAEWLAEAAISVVRGTTQTLDVLKIEAEGQQPIFSLSGYEYGIFPSTRSTISKYWYFGGLKTRIAFIIRYLTGFPTEHVDIQYVAPCDGCSKCHGDSFPKVVTKKETTRWWTAFIPKEKNESATPSVDYSQIINDDCGIKHSKESDFSTLFISTGLCHFQSLSPLQTSVFREKALWITTFPSILTLSNFLKAGLRYHQAQPLGYSEISETFAAKEISLSMKDANEKLCYIDKEEHEVQPLSITVLPKHLTVYG